MTPKYSRRFTACENPKYIYSLWKNVTRIFYITYTDKYLINVKEGRTLKVVSAYFRILGIL